MCQIPSPSTNPEPNNGNPTLVERSNGPRDLKRQTLLQDLVVRLSHGDLVARIQAARDLRKVVRSSEKARAAFAIPGVVQPLVEMLASQEHEAREVALLAVLNLAAKNERNKVSIVNFGAIPPLVELLKSESSRLRELATAAILSFSSSIHNKSIIASSGAVKYLVPMLISGSIQARVDAVTTLYNLSVGQESLDRSLCVESVPHLLSLLKDSKKFSKFAEKAMALIEALSELEEGRSAISEFHGGILILVETVEEGSALSVEYAAGTLLTLCRSCREKYRELILSEGAIPGLMLSTLYGTKRAKTIARDLLELLRDDSKSKRVTKEVLENVIYDIASQVDGPERAAETAVKLLNDMAQRNLELTASELQVKAAS